MGDWEGASPYGNGSQGGNEMNPYMYNYDAQPEGAQAPQQQPPRDGQGLENEKQQPQSPQLPHHQSQQPQSPQLQPWDNSKEKGPSPYDGAPPQHNQQHPQMQVCRHFLQGRCAFGYNCRFSHNVDPSVQPMAPPEGAVPQGYPVPPDYYYNQAPYPFAGGVSPYYAGYPAYYGAAQPYASHYGYPGYAMGGMSGGAPMDHSATKVRVPCRFFRQGICKYGAECRFSHEL